LCHTIILDYKAVVVNAPVLSTGILRLVQSGDFSITHFVVSVISISHQVTVNNDSGVHVPKPTLPAVNNAA
jgi:hypothetical protein